jgi:hypothetical protein
MNGFQHANLHLILFILNLVDFVPFQVLIKFKLLDWKIQERPIIFYIQYCWIQIISKLINPWTHHKSLLIFLLYLSIFTILSFCKVVLKDAITPFEIKIILFYIFIALLDGICSIAKGKWLRFFYIFIYLHLLLLLNWKRLTFFKNF